MQPNRMERTFSLWKEMEGFSTSYLDGDKIAGGYGSHRQPGEPPSVFDDITPPQAKTRYLTVDYPQSVDAASASVPKIVPGRTFGDLNEDQQDKLIERAGNMGAEYYKAKTSDGRNGFPKWAKAVIEGDEIAEWREWSRPDLPGRDKLYAAHFDPDGSKRAAAVAGTNPLDDLPVEDPEHARARRARSSEAGEEDGNGDPPASLADLVSSEAYQGLSPQQQLEKIAEINPDFRMIWERNPKQAEAFRDRMNDRYDDPTFWESVQGGKDIGIAGLQIAGANAAMIIEWLGIENDYDDSWRAAAELNFIDGQRNIGSDWYDQVGAILGGLPAGLAVPALATVGVGAALTAIPVTAAAAPFVAPIIGFGMYGALSAADQGGEAALKRGAIDALLGSIYPITASFGRPARMMIETGAAFWVSEQDDWTKRWIEALSFGMIAGQPAKRAPFAVMKKLGMPDHFEGAKLARIEARRTQEQNVASVASQKMIILDADGYQIGTPRFDADGKQIGTPLGDAFRTYQQMLRNEHPMMDHPAERSAFERERIGKRDVESRADQRPVRRDAGDTTGTGDKYGERYEPIFRPGPLWKENKPFDIGDGVIGAIYKKYKKAGEILHDVGTIFGMPFHTGLKASERQKGWGGWYNSFTQRTMLDRHGNVQTAAHEFGHHLSFTDPALRRLHDLRGSDVAVRLNELDELAISMNDKYKAQPEGVVTETGADVQYGGMILDENGNATISGIFKMWEDGVIPEHLQFIPELLSVSYDRDNLTEGMAEMFRLYFTNNKKFGGEVDIAHAFPQVSKAIAEYTKSLPRAKRRALERFQRDAHEHIAMTAEVAAGTTWGPDANPAGVLSTRAVMARQGYVDDFGGLMNLVQVQYGGRMVPDSVYETFRLLRGASEAADRMVNLGLPKWVVDQKARDKKGNPRLSMMIEYVGNGLQQILRPIAGSGTSLERFLRYATARQAKELRGQMIHKGKVIDISRLLGPEGQARVKQQGRSRENLYDDNMIEAGMRLADEKHIKKYEEVFEELQGFAEGMADFGEHAGLWSRDQRKLWQRTQYIFSFFREMEGDARKGNVSASTLTGSTPFSTLRGSTRNLKDPFALLLESHTRTFKLSLENMAKQELVRFITTARGGGRWGEMLKPIPKLKDFQFDTIKEAIATQLRKRFPGKTKKEMDALIHEQFPDNGALEKITLFLGNMKPHGDHIMTVYQNGKPTYYRMDDPMLIRSVQAMRRPQLYGWDKTWNWMRRFKQRFITMAPGFMAANFARDVAMASIMSRTGNFHLGKAMGGMWSAILQDKHYREFIANGGGGAGLREPARVTRRRVIQYAQRKGFDPRGLIMTPNDVLGVLDSIGRVGEIASRLGEYKAARKQGARAQHAAYMGREVSTDFAVRGDNAKMNFLSNTIPFFNAMVAGGDRMYRGVFHDADYRQATAMKVATVGVMSMGLYMQNREIPEYNDLPDWDKHGYWHFFIPKWNDDGSRAVYTEGNFVGQLAHTHFKMPKLWEVGVIGSIAERFLQSMFDDDDPDIIEFGLDVGHMITRNFGVNLEGKGFPLPIPVGIGTIIEQFGNRLTFTGNPIESQAMANQQAWNRSRGKQPKAYGEWGKLVQDVPGLNLIASPARAEALLRGIFGEFAMYGAHLADSIFFPGGPAMRLDQMPVVSRFYEGDSKYSKQAELFYERFESMKQAANTMDAIASNPARADELDAWLEKPGNLKNVAMRRHFQRQAATLSELSKYQELIRTGAFPEMTPQEMTDRINQIQADKNRIQRAMNEVAKEIDEELRKEEG